MRTVFELAFLTGISAQVMAQQQPIPKIQMLSPTECTVISKRPAGDYMVNGTIKVGSMTISNSNVVRGGINYGGVDPFDIITRSCFSGKST